MGTKLLVEGLPPSFSTQQLKDLFAPFGTVRSALVITDPTGKSLRMGKVEMSTRQEAETALRKMHRSQVQGKYLLVFKQVKKGGLPGKRRKKPHRLNSLMDEQKKEELDRLYGVPQVKEFHHTHRGFE